ncbi:MAG TPA: UDP-2,3-diacylglucosamine diphosphatase [Gemmatimonadaceae bacterium]|nr:UDP-2,3-diacylglucosamine diphosphatase [Gemmatimonadaceae bacterium]
MLRAPCYIVSDAHLGVASLDIERSFVGFLRGLAGRASSLVINGDLFDFWFEWKTVIPRRSFRALAALAELRDAGVEILWVAGNHDCWGGEILREDVGVDYVVGAWEGSIAGWNVRIEHGDGLREREDRGYRLIRPVMRNRIAIKAFRMLHPDWASRLAHGSSTASRTHRARDEGRGLRDYAARQLANAKELDLLVYGHSHVAALERMDGGGVFANAGSWLDAPTYLKLTSEAIELLEWDGSPEGKRLDSIDFRA